MPSHQLSLIATEGLFQGLSKQNMLFHECVGELVDNAIAATIQEHKSRVDIILSRPNDGGEVVDVWFADNCQGMSLLTLKDALQVGKSATTQSRLNEHGFGLKNALATLSGGNGLWTLWTTTDEDDVIYRVQGPFGPHMVIDEVDAYPEEDFLPSDLSTLIWVPTRLSFLQTVQGRGAPAKDLSALRKWLVEHLGVHYRGYLEQDAETYENSGQIIVSIERDHSRVPPVHVPFANKNIERFEVELGGNVVEVEYHYGTLDEVKRDALINGANAQYYYQGNQPTQGIDIRIGKRVIATAQFETIWSQKDGDKQLSRHNQYNEFVGELLIPELPRGILTTVNTKTDFNLDDPNWTTVFQKLNEFRPIRDMRQKTEGALRDKWIRMLTAVNEDDEVSDERSIWPTGTRVDVYRKTPEGKVIVYEVKAGSGSPIHLYQLKMYWDGLVLTGEHPREAILLVEDYHSTLEERANMMNELPPPKEDTNPYNFRIEKHQDKGLIDDEQPMMLVAGCHRAQ